MQRAITAIKPFIRGRRKAIHPWTARSFYAHYAQRLSCAAAIEDAKIINRGARVLRQRATRAKGAGSLRVVGTGRGGMVNLTLTPPGTRPFIGVRVPLPLYYAGNVGRTKSGVGPLKDPSIHTSMK